MDEEMMETRLVLLETIYQAYEEFTGAGRWACKPGCAACCTLNVTATTLEISYLVRDLDEERKIRIGAAVTRTDKRSIFRPLLTTNALARLCINRIEPPEEAPGNAVGSCPLLTDGLCSRYEHRPFGCRLMVSEIPCDQIGEAITPMELVTVNIVTQQLIEHLDRGGRFGNMLDALEFILRDQEPEPEASSGLAMNEPLPGYLIPPEHVEYANAFLRLLFQKQTPKGPFGKVLAEV